ncbi:MAG: hypothetical protein EA421_01285 [Gemmatimonadales bacterium]|nr:MAG: hypothetical protein EA421_01285 [Gemmatimonadales bacterium]
MSFPVVLHPTWFRLVPLLLVLTPLSLAGQAEPSGPSLGEVWVGDVLIDGAPPPLAPETITRDERGRATVRAIRLAEPLQVDGILDEEIYRTTPPFGGLVQVAPVAGEPSSERSDIWVMYDDTHMYVACRCWDAAPPEEWVANELRRDSNGLRQNDHFGVMFDTFYDRRSGFMFYSNPLAARADYSVIDEGGPNSDWNPVWEVRTGRFEGGWTIEMAIPFRSLRYRSGPDQVWGFQVRRSIRHKNEWAYLNPVPAFLAGPQALNRVSAAGTLVGLDLPDAGRNLEFKPYVITSTTTDRLQAPTVENRWDGDLGIDVKYGITANLTADLTVNTDFAQVEVDEQQVNLTRFNLFFPEKREFFLEGRGVFDFGRGGAGGGPGARAGDTPFLFYSRRIGLEQGQVVPIDVGGRITGKAGPFGIGLLNIRTGGVGAFGLEPTDFTVVRLKRDVLRSSAIGGMFTRRSMDTSGMGSSRAYGVDGTFSFFQNLRMSSYLARTETENRFGDDRSWQGTVSYEGDLYGGKAEALKVGEDFNPEVGFTRRRDFRKGALSARFSPRPASLASVRKFTWEASLDYFEDGAGRMETREQGGKFDVEFENSDQFTLEGERVLERLANPFPVGRDLILPVGEYRFSGVRAAYQFGSHRRISGTASLRHGGFFDGTLTSLGFSRGRMVVNNHLSVDPGLTVNWLDLPAGELRQVLLRNRVDYAFTPLMFASALLQYNSNDRTFSGNLRFRWEYHPGSEVFLVLTDERDTHPEGIGLRNRALVFKATRLLTF